MIDKYKYPIGISLVIIGFLFFIKQTGVLPDSINDFIFNWRNIPIFIGFIFLFTKNLKESLILFAVGILAHIDTIIGLTKSYSKFVWPVIFMVVGVILVLSQKFKK